MSAASKLLVVWAVIGAASGCVTTPFNEQTIGGRTDPVAFSGYASAPDALIELGAIDVSGAHSVFATARSSKTVSLAAGTVGDNMDLYAWSVTSKVASADTLGRWRPVYGDCGAVDGHCTPYDGGYICSKIFPSCYPSYYVATLTITERGARLRNLATFDQGGNTCVMDELTRGEPLTRAVSTCMSPDWPYLHLRANP